MFRQAVGRGGELGKQVEVFLEKGELVPDEVTIKLVLDCITAADRNGTILDGFPRNMQQAEALDRIGGKTGGIIDRVVHLPISEAELVRRLSGRLVCSNCETSMRTGFVGSTVASECHRCGGVLYQRQDDTPEIIKKRYEVYLAETTPLIDYYEKQHKLVEVNGEGSVSTITERIIAALSQKELAS
jgi:adenylate kinase